MEITREGRGNIDSHPISQQEKGEFFRIMRQVVVVVINKFRPDGSSGMKEYCAGGIVVDKRGYILTAASLIPRKGKSVLVVNLLNGDSYNVTPIDTNYKKGMSLLKFVDGHGPSDELNYVKFANEIVHLGAQTFTIGHPNFLFYSFSEGQVCCESVDTMEITNSTTKCRSVDDLRKSTSDHNIIPTDLKDSLPLIQVSNVHGSSGTWGSPLFNSRGHVIGMHLLSFEKFDYALHFEIVKNFIESAISQKQPLRGGFQNKLERQKMERGEGSGKGSYRRGH